MLNRFARALFTRIFRPVAAFLVRRGVSPDVVTLIGTVGVAVGALTFYPRGEFFWGTMFISAFVFSDLVDGTMARMTNRSSRWGAWLDSTLDRVGDAAVFGGIAMYFAREGADHDLLMTGLALYCLASGAIVSYARARAEGLGMTADVGVTERADRLVLILVCTGFAGIGVPYIQAAALWLLALGSTVTIAQRALVVRRQSLAEPHAAPGPPRAQDPLDAPTPDTP